jgi:hypothetical protein
MHFFNHTMQLSFNAEISDLLLCPSNNSTLWLFIIIIIIPFRNYIQEKKRNKKQSKTK